MDFKNYKIYGYTITETGKQIVVMKENRALMSFDKRFFTEDRLAGWRLSRVLQEVENIIREEVEDVDSSNH